MKKLITVLTVVAALIGFTGCSTTNSASEQATVTTLADLGTTGAIMAYPQYRPAMEIADAALTAECGNSNGIPSATTIQQLLTQAGVTNAYVQLGISGAALLLDQFAANQVTNGVPAESTIQQGSCWISAGMTAALGSPVMTKAPKPVKHWYYLWIK